MTVQAQALAAAGAIASRSLELPSATLEIVRTALPASLFALALLMVESDPEFSRRWQAAGDDWMLQAEVLRAVVLWILTPEGDA